MKALPTNLVKICGLTRVEDVTLAVNSGANAVGFIFAPSTRRVSIERARELSKVAQGVLRVGVMKDLGDQEILEHVDAVTLDAVQLHEAPSPELYEQLRQRDLRLFLVHHRGSVTPDSAEHFDALLLDNPAPGSGELNDFKVFGADLLATPRILAGGLDPENIFGVIQEFRPYGVDVASGVESAPGIKDEAKVLRFITMANQAFEEQ
jgi:phosphoribosylanthranilate isomerase